jgi:hypothetical protein
LTVSKAAKDGGQFRSISEALARVVHPGMTIRILDRGTYTESIAVNKPNLHEGLTLEAVQPATLVAPPDAKFGVIVDHVPHVTIRGLHDHRGLPSFVMVSGHSPGVSLEDLETEAKGLVLVVVLQKILIAPSEDPLVVKRCGFKGGKDAIWVSGPANLHNESTRTSGILIRDNRISGVWRGVVVQGGVGHCQITGNRIWNCKMVGLQLEDLATVSDHLLFANHTVVDSGSAFRVWDDPPFRDVRRGQVEVRNNLFFNATEADMGFALNSESGMGTRSGDGKSLVERWRFDHNWRDLSGAQAGYQVPLAPDDKLLDRVAVLSRDPTQANYLRPAPDWPPAKEGAGLQDRTLPTYAGAVPPEGVESWDWDRTWRWRAGTGGGRPWNYPKPARKARRSARSAATSCWNSSARAAWGSSIWPRTPSSAGASPSSCCRPKVFTTPARWLASAAKRRRWPSSPTRASSRPTTPAPTVTGTSS